MERRLEEVTKLVAQLEEGLPDDLTSESEVENAGQILTPEQNKAENQKSYEAIDFKSYDILYGSADTAITYYKHKNNPDDQLVRIIWPGSEYPVVVRVPEKRLNDTRLAEMTQTWKQIENKVMIDEDFLVLLCEVASRYNRKPKQSPILEGPPGVSKTFVTWVFACVMGEPYDIVSFSSGTRESSFIGGTSADTELSLVQPLEEILQSPLILERLRLMTEVGTMDKNDLTFFTAIKTVIDLHKKNTPLRKMIIPLKAIETQLGTQFFTESAQRWIDANFLYLYEHGGIGTLDEVNTVEDTGVVEKLLPVTAATMTSWEIHPKRQQGPRAKRHKDFFAILTQNPPNVGGRQRLTGAMESRCEKVIVKPITEKKVADMLNYFMTGNDPEIRIGGRVFKGRQNVPTEQRFLETMPKREVVVRFLAKFHVQLVEMVQKAEIGQKKSDGGNYEFDQRDIAALLSEMMQTITNRMVTETAGKLSEAPVKWSFVVRNAIERVYLTGVTGTEQTGDRKKIIDLIDAMPLWKILEDAQASQLKPVGNNPKEVTLDW